MFLDIQLDHTIVALASGQGGAIANIRISGKKTFDVVGHFFSNKKIQISQGNEIFFGKIIDNKGALIDECLVSCFKSPKSYTGEDSVEIHCHASPYIIAQIIQLCLANGCVHAQPGEFTMRAFLNGKMDLAQAEAVADIIASDSKAAHAVAMNQLKGGFSQDIVQLREGIMRLAALLELELDFGEEDVEFANRQELSSLLKSSINKISQLIASFKLGNVIKDGIPIAIIGEPNVGKSTLLNVFLGEERAIVSEIAGTTRDTIEDTVVWDGYKIRFIDTAGLRKTEDVIEKMGIDRALDSIKKAQIILHIFDKKEGFAEMHSMLLTHSEADSLILKVHNKSDLIEQLEVQPDIHISAKNKTGIEALKARIIDHIKSQIKPFNTLVVNSRHIQELSSTKQALEKALDCLEHEDTHDFIAAELRFALHHLGSLTGQIQTDDLLDIIFRDFCIGK